ncbi:hypothetical protein RJT34_28976 [Clitoria ternatea]|uniref:Uncharacterized protein n=1 Tax=Clitoria ternatea TaxID=43366 RepID=A0AAN9FDX1_CLITE
MATNLRIPTLFFSTLPLYAIHSLKSLHSDYTVPFVILDFPHSKPSKPLALFLEYVLELALKTHDIIMNNFAELDGEDYVEHYQKTTGHKALGVSLTKILPQAMVLKRRDRRVRSEHICLIWLDSKAPKSVVYICFGSICHFPDKQPYEIACAIEASGHEFIWVVPEKKGKEEKKEKWLPKGFEERNRENVLIIKGWAPQLLILNHPALGAFVTHCGGNSSLKAVTARVLVITWLVIC